MNEVTCSMKKEREIRRGDLYYADLGENVGSIQGGSRPVLVVQNDIGNKHSPTVLVAVVTSVIKKLYMPVHAVLRKDYGLTEPSMVEAEQIRTLNKSQLERYIGHIDEESMEPTDRALVNSFGLLPFVDRAAKERIKEARWNHAIETQPHSKDGTALELTLCTNCARQFFYSPDHIIRRVHRQAEENKICMYCDSEPGWEYRITRRMRNKRIAVQEDIYE